MIEIFAPIFIFSDDRGVLTQLIDGGYTDVNVVFTYSGAKRGGFHYHKLNSEVFYIISGKILLITDDERLSFGSGDMFKIPPNTGHSLEFLEDTYFVSLYNHGVTLPDGSKDIYEEDKR